MANNLSPELLAQLRALTGNGFNPGIPVSEISSGGYSYVPGFSGGAVGEAGDGNSLGSVTNYFGYDPNNRKPGVDMMNVYGTGGDFAGQAKIGTDEWKKNLLLALAGAGGAWGLGSLVGGAAGSAGLGANGAFLGEGALSGVPAWDGALSGVGAGSSIGANGAFLGEGAASGIPGWDLALDTAAGGGGLGVAPGAGAGLGGAMGGGGGSSLGGAAAGGGALSSLGGMSSLLGPAATALGALAGGQGTDGTTSERKMDPRLDQYVYGQGGTVPMTASLLAQQSPLAQQAGQQASLLGQNLLKRGVASNPFMR